MNTVVRLLWCWLRAPFWVGLGLLVGFGVPYVWSLDHQVRQRIDQLQLSTPTRVFARPVVLKPGAAMDGQMLALDLNLADYHQVDHEARVPGTWSRDGGHFTIASRGFAGPAGGALPRRISVRLKDGRVASVTDLTSDEALPRARLDPARIATLYGARQEERRIVALEQVPTLLQAGLQAVEDRDFKRHFGIDFSAIARAALANLRAGHIVQGASTLTQQLARNLFLDRSQTYIRKANEALIAILIESHYSKKRILETYINEVFLGQQGYQAVHGFAAASQFYFGRRLQYLRPAEIALLVGMVRGPSYYSPRRHPDNALARRNHVLEVFQQTGLISAAEHRRAGNKPLGVNDQPQLPHDRFPAFMDLVSEQIRADFDRDTLHAGGLSVFTTLDPGVQVLAERALSGTLDAMGEEREKLQGAVVVTGADNGHVLAMVGNRHASVPGFNRALDAHRPVGSVIKPFVYLVALADPQTWTLATPLDDSPVRLRRPSGEFWTPENDDHESHGYVPLIDALANSWNLATVHLGLALGVQRVADFLESLGLQRDVTPYPSLLLGAINLSPLDVAQMYQFLAAGGHALPLLSVRGVMDADGNVLKRYGVRKGGGDYATAVKLVTYAMQEVATTGTAHRIVNAGLGGLHAAGKTGTSDGQRDSWFAGFTGEHLAVVWVGRDDNQKTGLWGSSGALKVWIDLFEHLPTRPLPRKPTGGVEFVWVNPLSGRRTTAGCEGARYLPFASGYLPEQFEPCLYDRFRDIFEPGQTAPGGHQ